MSEEDLALEAFTEFLNAVEAGISAARQHIKAAKVEWDPSKIKWEPAEGSKGPYERSEDVNNPEHKAMVKDLATHGGQLTHQGWFYWVFKNGSTVGRKRRGKGEAPTEEAGEKTAERFPGDLRSLLTFEETPEWTLIRPRQFLGSENFSRIAAIVREAGGEYVSVGKESHFRIPRKPAK